MGFLDWFLVILEFNIILVSIILYVEVSVILGFVLKSLVFVVVELVIVGRVIYLFVV